ncbi:MAG: hypothetical protein ACPL3E_00135 [Minisyncoccia bacterium]
MNKNKTLLEKIQSLDRKTKTKMLVALSLIAIFFVVYIWLTYFNFMMFEFAANNNVNYDKEEGVLGFGDKLKSSGAFVWQSLIFGAKSIGSIFGSGKEYIVK